jgi:ankyrin repeat protein
MQWEWNFEPYSPLSHVQIAGDILYWWQDTDNDPRNSAINEKQTVPDFQEFGPLWHIPDDVLKALLQQLDIPTPPWLEWPTPGIEEMTAYVNKGDMVSLRFLLSQGIRPDGRDKGGYDPFYRAVRAGRRDIALWFLEQGYPPNRYYHHHRTALMVAVEEREREVIATLLARGADPKARDDWGESVLSRAARYEGTPLSIVQLLVEAGADDLDGALVQAVYYNNRRIVEYLLQRGADVNGRDSYGWSPLEASFRRGGDHPGMVRTLIAAGADLRQPFSHGWTMVHAAAQRAWGKIMQVGLDAGVPVDSREPGLNSTPLMVAVQNGKNLAAVKALIAAGADVNARASSEIEGQTPLIILAQYGDFWDMAETLINAGADVNATDHQGLSALVYAVERNAKMVVRLLLEKGADANVRALPQPHLPAGYLGSSVLKIATEKKDSALVAALLQAGANANNPEAYNFTPLHQAAFNNNVAMVRLLLEHGANPNGAEEDTHRTPLYYAKDDAVRRLIEEAGGKASTD